MISIKYIILLLLVLEKWRESEQKNNNIHTINQSINQINKKTHTHLEKKKKKRKDISKFGHFKNSITTYLWY